RCRASVSFASPSATASSRRRMSVFAVERQRRFSCRCRAAWRTRFSCCLIFGISEKDPQLAGRAMVATPLPMLPPWKTPSISGTVNAFEIAFLIPNTVRSLVADSALSAAFVPVFSDLLVKGERQRAWRVASSIFWLMLLGLGGLTAFFIVIAPWVMELFGYG